MAWTLILSLALSSAACGTSATIFRNDHSRVEAEIVDGSPTTITVRDAEGRESKIPKADIRYIRHPGHAALGAGIVVMLAVLVAVTAGVRNRGDGDLPYLIGIAPLILGGGLVVYGTKVNLRSHDAADGIDVKR